MAFTAGLKSEIQTGKQSKHLHCSYSRTACQETSSRSKCCREGECGRGTRTRTKNCTLRTRQAPGRTASLWTVIFSRFRSMPSFPYVIMHKMFMSRRLPDTERAQTPMFSVWIKSWEKTVHPPVSHASFHSFPGPQRDLYSHINRLCLSSNTACFSFLFECICIVKNTTAQVVRLFLNCVTCTSHEPSKSGD